MNSNEFSDELLMITEPLAQTERDLVDPYAIIYMKMASVAHYPITVTMKTFIAWLLFQRQKVLNLDGTLIC